MIQTQTLAQFKKENELTTIQFYKGGKKPNGCQFADTPVGRVFLSPKTNTAAPLFVMVNNGEVRPDLKGTYWIVNNDVTLGSLL